MNLSTNLSGTSAGGSSFNFGAAPSAAAQPQSSTPVTAATVGGGFFAPQNASITAGTAATVSSNLAFGSPAATTTTSVLPAATSGGFAVPNPVNTAAATDASKRAAASLKTATATTPSTGNATASQLNFCQLEELINKWTLELEEQEKMFINQATQVNSWDKVLISNGHKIVELSEAVEKVKIEQQAMEHKLEFIAAQHLELDECVTPLQKEYAKQSHTDVEKAQTYNLAENLDTQLRQMSEDLKEVIEHLNEANKVQDTNDPIVQIGLILNAHMSSLQWIESSATQITTKIDDISNMYDELKRDNERSFRLTYNE